MSEHSHTFALLSAKPGARPSVDGEARFEHLIDRSADAILVVSAQGRVRFANRAAAELFARPADELEGLLVGVPLCSAATVEVDVPRADGGAALAELRVLDSLWAGEAAYLACLRDVSHHARTREALLESEERYALAARAANDGLWDWNLLSGRIEFSPRWKAMLGCADDEIGGDPDEWFRRIHPEDVERVRAALRTHMEGLTSHFENEYRMLHKGGSWRWVLCRGLAARDGSGRAVRLAGSQSDVTHRKLAEEQLAHRAFYDPLTNLPNRSLFLDRLRHALRRAARRRDYLFAVLFLDIDRFKLINDSLGHMAGDRLLVQFARRLEVSLRPGDSVARLGGDEFTVLLDDIKDIADATRVAERVQEGLALPFDLGGQEIYTSASIGIALSVTGYEKPEDILRDADTAMYRAKALGRARHTMFDTTMHAHAVARLQIEADLRRALERGEFRVHYQPIVSLESGRITGVEALARWQHPERGLVSPSEFIPVAEETGIIVSIGEWVLRESCRQLQSWRAAGPGLPHLLLSVNFSSKQLALPDLAQQIGRTLDETGFEASSLQIEITESALIEHPDAAARVLADLKRLGVQLTIDDFGTGYSSLAYLQRFPIDSLKIDRSFVQGMPAGAGASKIARAVVLIGQSLGIGVIAEGVETPDQLALLRSFECQAAQGYLFSRPVDGEAARTLVAIGRRW